MTFPFPAVSDKEVPWTTVSGTEAIDLSWPALRKTGWRRSGEIWDRMKTHTHIHTQTHRHTHSVWTQYGLKMTKSISDMMMDG